MDRHAGRAAGGPAAGHRPRPLRRRHQFRAPASHADGALQPRARPHRCRSTPREARALPGVVAVWTARDIADIGADRFPRGADREARAVPPAGAGHGQGALRRRAGRRGVRRGPLRRRGRRRAGRRRDRGIAAAARRPRRARRVLARPRHRSRRSCTQGYGDVEAVFASRAHHRRAGADLAAGTPACRWRRAARSAATTPRATCWSCTAPPRCRTGTRS